jgi:hypothetical protein
VGTSEHDNFISPEKLDTPEKYQHLNEISIARKHFRPPKISANCYTARRPGFYIVNAFFLIFLITIVSFAVFAINTKTPHFRLQTTYTLLLTAISLKWVIMNRTLPIISYLTSLDVYQIASFTFICLLAAWHALIASFWPDLGYSKELDNIMCVVFALVLVLGHVLFLGWVFYYNKKRRQLKKDELAYYTKYKDHFIPHERSCLSISL